MTRDGVPDGVPDGARWTRVPDAFFALVLPAVADLATLKVALHVLWRVTRRAPGEPPALRLADLANDTTLLRGLGVGALDGDGTRGLEEAGVSVVLEACVRHLEDLGWLLVAQVEGEAGRQCWVWPNVPEGRRHHRRWVEGGVALPERAVAIVPRPTDRSNVFVVYEENIGIVTPMIAEELTEAEGAYPAGWIEDAIREAVENNVRRWSYVKAILERWSRDGRGDETDRRGGKEARGRDADGPFADIVQH